MKPDYVAIGARLKAARNLKELTQQELADLIGVSVSYVKNIERGGKPSLEYLLQAAEHCKASLDWLLTGVLPCDQHDRDKKEMVLQESITPPYTVEAVFDPDLKEMIDIIKYVMNTENQEQRIWAKYQLKRAFAEFTATVEEEKKHHA